MQDEFIKTATSAYPNLAVAANDKFSTLVQVERNIQFTTNGNWINGRTHYVDLQIDHTEGKYTLAVPKVEFSLEGEDWGIKISPDGKTTVPYREKIKGDLTHQGSVILSPIEWDILSDSFTEGQREIVIRKEFRSNTRPNRLKNAAKIPASRDDWFYGFLSGAETSRVKTSRLGFLKDRK